MNKHEILSLSEQKEFLLNGASVSGNKKLYVHEVSLRQKLLDSSSSPALIPATYQGVISYSSNDCTNPTDKGNIANILQKIILAK